MNTETSNGNAVGTAEREIVITRTFDAPRDLVWKVWTQPEHITHWWGPQHFTSPVCEIDFRVGGRYLYCMRSPEGEDFWSTGMFREIVEPERIVYTDAFADEHGNPVPASHYKMTGDWPDETLVTVTLEENDGKTNLTLRHVGIPTGETSEMTAAGWQESLDKMARHLHEINE